MPPVNVGDIVYWFQSPGSSPVAALVTSVSAENVALAVFHPGMVNHVSLDGVRHRRDPKFRNPANQEAGIWDYRFNEDESPASTSFTATASR